MRTKQIAIMKDGHAFRIEAPARAKIFHAEPSLDVDFDILCVDGEMYLARRVLELARSGLKGFRLVGFDRCPTLDDQDTAGLGRMWAQLKGLRTNA
jgi:hypothetical protein